MPQRVSFSNTGGCDVEISVADISGQNGAPITAYNKYSREAWAEFIGRAETERNLGFLFRAGGNTVGYIPGQSATPLGELPEGSDKDVSYIVAHGNAWTEPKAFVYDIIYSVSVISSTISQKEESKMADRNNGRSAEIDREQHRKKELDEILKSEPRFRYMLLSRLEMDCEYYLGYGNRNERKLWGGNVRDHIWYVKELWHNFPEGEKPQWLSLEQIEEYGKQMGVSPTRGERTREGERSGNIPPEKRSFTAEQEAVIQEAEEHGVPDDVMKIIKNPDLTTDADVNDRIVCAVSVGYWRHRLRSESRCSRPERTAPSCHSLKKRLMLRNRTKEEIEAAK